AEVRAPVPGAYRAGWQLLREQREEVGPVDAHVPAGLRELVRFMPRGPPVGEPQLGRDVPRAQPPDSRPYPEPVEHPQSVRRQRHPGAGPCPPPGRRPPPRPPAPAPPTPPIPPPTTTARSATPSPFLPGRSALVQKAS